MDTPSFDPADYAALRIHGFVVSGQDVVTRYVLESKRGAQDISFEERFTFPKPWATSALNDRLLRLLTLTAAVSYYKLAAPPTIRIGFPVADFEEKYLAELIRGGLGEFAFRNDLWDALSPQIEATTGFSSFSGATEDSWNINQPPLVPVGGGKDSIVSIETLKRNGYKPILFSVNRYGPIDDCIIASQLESVHVSRTIDTKVVPLNKRGAHNGHIPITAINSVLALIMADARGLGSVVMSNERSADFGNLDWRGVNINHQWSKSGYYENLLRNSLTSYGLSPDRYFSLLRSMSESEIADNFSNCSKYFDIFVSCNRAFALDPERRGSRWCGQCPKCLFVFVLLAPRITKKELIRVFGHNVLDRATNEEIYRELAGLKDYKPFECVGEYSEVADALLRLLDDGEWSSDAILERLVSERDALNRVASSAETASHHNVPGRYTEALNDLLSA